jgi:TonB family protein
MDELSSAAAVIEITNAVRWGLKLTPRMRKVLISLVVSLVSVSSLHAQSARPAGQPPPPRAIYTPKPVYRPEWTKQGLTGKGVVLVTIDKQTGMVTGARMLTSTGNQQLDGAALQAYSQWRFDPRTVAVSQLKIPIEFANRPKPQTAKRTLSQPAILYPLLILIGFAVAVMAMRTRRRDTR